MALRVLIGIIVCIEAAVGLTSNIRPERALPPQGQVTVYINENYKGTSESYTLPKWVCVDIDPSFVGYISSIKPARGTCVQVFKARGCPESEKPQELKEHSLGTDTLAKIGLNDQISSIKYCDPY